MKLQKPTKKSLILTSVILLLVAAIIVLAFPAIKHWREKESTYYDQKCAAFTLENTNFARGQIVFIGDSLTDGCALDVYYAGLPLATYNRGIGGDTTAGVLKRLQYSLLELQPSKIVLLIGVNDIHTGVSNEKLLENYEEILKRISTALPDTQVICVSLLPLNRELEQYTGIKIDQSIATILELNPQIEALAQAYGYTFADVFAQLANEEQHLYDQFTTDGVHLSHEGYLKLSSLIRPLLQ